MSKELTPLEALKGLRMSIKLKDVSEPFEFWRCHNIIETALKDYEQLKSRENNVLPNDEFIGDLGEHTRDEIAMKLKALEIIKKIIKYDIKVNGNNTIPEYAPNDVFTKEEYNFIKEVLL